MSHLFTKETQQAEPEAPPTNNGSNYPSLSCGKLNNESSRPPSLGLPPPKHPSSPQSQRLPPQRLPQKELPPQQLPPPRLPPHRLPPQRLPFNPAWIKQKLIVYGDSNYKSTHRQLKTEINALQRGATQGLHIEFRRTFTLEKTFHVIKERDHTDCIVLISVSTNNARRRQSTEYVRGIQQQITWMLSTETHPSNIIFLACPPAKCFLTTEYNQNTEALCKEMGVKFAKSLIKESHLNDEDGYHITPENQHFMAKTVAAAALPCINGQTG